MPKKHTQPYTRVRGEIIPGNSNTSVITRLWKYKNAADVVQTSGEYSSIPDAISGTEMIDVVTPGYLQKVAKGAIINNPMSMRTGESEFKQTANGKFYEWANMSTNPNIPNGTNMYYTHSRHNWFPSISAFPSISFGDLDHLSQDAINAAFANAHQRDVMGLVDLAEMEKTFDMVHTNLGRLVALTSRGGLRGMTHKLSKAVYNKRDLRSNAKVMYYRPKTALGHAADASGLWLEWNYGVKPTMMSIQGLIRALSADVHRSVSVRKTYRGSDSFRDSDKKSKTVTLTGSYGTSVEYYDVERSINAYARAGLLSDYSPSLRARLGMETRDLVPMAYELIPMSFVFDWMFDMGTYLEAITPVPGFTTQASWCTHFVEDSIQYVYRRPSKVLSSSGVGMETYFEQYAEAFAWKRIKQRTPGVAPGLPKLDPQLKSLTHLVSGAALAFSQAQRSKAFRKLLTTR